MLTWQDHRITSLHTTSTLLNKENSVSSNVNYSYTVKFEESGTIDAIVYRDVDGIKRLCVQIGSYPLTTQTILQNALLRRPTNGHREELRFVKITRRFRG